MISRKAKGGSIAIVKREAIIRRDTNETKITLALIIEGQGRYEIRTGIRFFDHMLELFTRHGAFDLMPMDETLGIAAVDLSGRIAAVVKTKVKARLVGDLQSELVNDFFEGFAQGARANVHLKVMYGRSSHHKIEALFKAFARALRVACSRDKQLGDMLPSTKGLL
jgi:imidazoleglycerol-phosphate dehydratase